MRKGWFLLFAILISLSGCGEKQKTESSSEKSQTEESKPNEQATSSNEKQKAEQNKPKEQTVAGDVKQNTEENKPKKKTDSSGVKQDVNESKPKAQIETSGKTADDDNQVKVGENGEYIIDFEIEKGTNKVIWHIPGADGLLQMSVGQKLKLHHKNMDPDQPLKILVSADTLSMDEVPHEGRVAIPIEEYTIHAIKKGQAEITIAPNADLKFGDKFGINIK
ncbi:hypothetical protein CN900_27015 [Bacillus anthracis]|uniref:hypothetical protein n=1 Tax=Bacillus tropicus TaxID=2026188 RepID=UPI000BF3CD39|nr:hypothetical protein [Bacillus tropicus]PET28399.1 hypothetical protein CN518_24985 [Bacillus anthracis]PGH82727.1 hypothetical protein CN900_27015 [Bacillus anthracis]PGV40303.1 hypothetical protein COD75_04955 [Bacillus anthracis]